MRSSVGTRGTLIVLATLASAWLSGCAAERTRLSAWTLPQLPEPRVRQLPLTVGVHYSDSFRRDEHEDRYPSLFWYMHPPGDASVALFDSVLASTFERVAQLRAWPPEPGAKPSADVFVVPSIDSVQTDSTYLSRTITYRVRLYSADGKEDDLWRITASGAGTIFTDHKTFSDLALRDAAAQLLTGLPERPAVRSRLEETDRSGTARTHHPDWRGVGGVAILPMAAVRSGDPWVTCLKDNLGEADPQLRVVDEARFRDGVFPWFEPSTRPKTPEEWTRLLKDPLVTAGALDSGTRYVALVGGFTLHGTQEGPFTGFGGYGGAGYVGVKSGSRDTTINLTVGDFARSEVAGQIKASESGSATWVGIIIPIPVISPTESNACEKAAAAVQRLVRER